MNDSVQNGPPQPPPAQHTDRCVQDAAQYGFCDHTRLFADPQAVRAHDLHLFIEHRTREYASWFSLTFLVAGEIIAFTATRHWYQAVAVSVLLASAWSGLFAAGLPSALTADPTRERHLPLDVQLRLMHSPATRVRVRRRSRSSKHRRP